jgi:pimeloyl-ACP methyl ester carboxylesterase
MGDGAYASIQTTRPETLAAGLNDSPVGLAGWIVEKFQTMSGDTDIEKHFTRDELLTNLTLYWVTQSLSSSLLPYYDIMHANAFTWIGETIKDAANDAHAPAAFALFPKDNSQPPKEWAERFFNVQRWSHLERGGHFGAMEAPELLAADIRDFFRPLRTQLQLES